MLKKRWKDITILVLIVALAAVVYVNHEAKQEERLDLLMNRQIQIINALQGKATTNKLSKKEVADKQGKETENANDK